MAKQLLIILYCIGFLSSSFAAQNSLRQGQNLSDWESLVSANGIFKLRFFSTSSSGNSRYLGIWRNFNMDEDDSIWVANRDTPVGNSAGKLTIDGDGKIKILHEGGDPIVLNSDQGPTTSNNLIATLLDTGNFVLKDMNGTEEIVLWQSFDYPTDTLLPGMKIGFNYETGRNWSLNSWFNSSSPAAGAFTLGMDPNGTDQLIIKRREVVYWRSGVWDSVLGFRNLLISSYDDEYYNFIYVSNKKEKYFTYSVKNTSDNALYKWKIEASGEIRKLEWINGWSFIYSPSVFCNGFPYDSDYRSGCVYDWEKTLTCDKRSELWFGGRLGDMDDSAAIYRDDNSSMGESDCEAMCRQNCSCFAYATNDNGTGCNLWGKDWFLSTYPRRLIYFIPKDGKKKWLWSLTAISILPVMFLICICCYLRRRKRKLKGNNQKDELFIELGSNIVHKFRSTSDELKNDNKKGGRDLQFFSFDNIVIATDNFSSQNKLGQGGFGPVYKGKLITGQEIAVKRLSKNSGQGVEEFKNEIRLIAELQHTNLVRLLGCCVHGEENMLVYEYLPNKSLDFFLFDSTRKELLNWSLRFNIIEGIAQGLLYLHKYSRLRVIHRDLKAGNILLDDEMNPKISDFGMARIFGSKESEANTNRVVGTYGYMSPEYAMEGIFSVKSDVYSFGVLLLEILSGRKNNSFYNLDHPLNLIGYAWKLWTEDYSIQLMDPTLGSSGLKNQVQRCIHVGLLCVQDDAMDRPTMSDVISMLSNETMPLPAPKQPAFSGGKRMMEVPGLPKEDSKNCSVNHASVSTIIGR